MHCLVNREDDRMNTRLTITNNVVLGKLYSYRDAINASINSETNNSSKRRKLKGNILEGGVTDEIL